MTTGVRLDKRPVAPAVPARLTAALTRPINHPPWLKRALLRAGAAIIVGNIIIESRSDWLDPQWLGLPLTVIVIGGLLLSALGVVIAAVRGSTSTISGWVYVAVVGLANVTVAAAPQGPVGSGNPYLMSATLAATCLAASIASTPGIGALTVFVVLGAFALVRLRDEPGLVVLAETGQILLLALVTGEVIRQFAEVFGRRERIERAALRAREGAARSAHREGLLASYDRLVHDKVLGALLIASRAHTPDALAPARSLAQDALAAFDGEGARAGDLGTIAHRHGLLLEGDTVLPAGLPPDVGSAVHAAAEEAFANVARHAEVEAVDVVISGSSDRLQVTISDNGRGFLPDATVGRLGVRTSIPGHLAAVGGHAVVTSTPGLGTRVSLSWAAPSDPGGDPVADFPTPGVNTWARLVLAFLWWSLLFALGLMHHLATPEEPPWTAPMWAAALGLLVAGLFANLDHHTWSAAILGSLLIATTSVLILAAASDGGPADWRYWFIVAVTPIYFGFLVQRRTRIAVVSAGLIVLSVVVGTGGDILRHGEWVRVLLAPLAAFIYLPVRWSLDRADADARRAAAAVSAARVAEAKLEQDASVRAERRATLEHRALPMLRQILVADDFSAADRRSAGLIEAATRDVLVAPGLVDETIAQQASQARAAGAEIIFRVANSADPNDPGLATFRTTVGRLLSCAGEGSQVTAYWHPGQSGSVGSVTVNDPTRAPGTLDSPGVRTRLEVDEGEIWYEQFSLTEWPATTVP